MPTATTTTTTPASVLSLKASSSSSTATTLRSLYPRAARAFLQRDVPLTHSLLNSAFTLLGPPASVVSVNDAFASQRRKWDILRVTFETTLYASPPSAQDPEHLPAALRANLMLSPEPLIATIHNRSLVLFTPLDSPQKSSSAFLPSQILVTLVLASLKLDCTDVGRGMIEDWLAKHGQEEIPDDPKGYAKVLELYCLHILPRLEDWDYAEDFLTYERELPPDVRQQYTTSLRQLRAEAAANAHARASLPLDSTPSSSASSRSVSPVPSDSSASSSSTHTATPRAPRASANGRVRSLTPFTPSQSPTPKPREPDSDPDTAPLASRSRPRAATPAAASSASTSSASVRDALIRRASFTDPVVPARAPSTLALLSASVRSLLKELSRTKVLACAVLFVVLPLVSFALRLRRRRVAQGAGSGPTVDAVRRRLRGAEAQGGVAGRVWQEVARAVLDTVRMAGRGLV
ncbi:hypothetical protein C8Q79DRAFT_903518 [Trametes meyenii]|nr:hypothetical protein C8Q79DRAFT_903518 [Trametes meyenii]